MSVNPGARENEVSPLPSQMALGIVNVIQAWQRGKIRPIFTPFSPRLGYGHLSGRGFCVMQVPVGPGDGSYHMKILGFRQEQRLSRSRIVL